MLPQKLNLSINTPFKSLKILVVVTDNGNNDVPALSKSDIRFAIFAWTDIIIIQSKWVYYDILYHSQGVSYEQSSKKKWCNWRIIIYRDIYQVHDLFMNK